MVCGVSPTALNDKLTPCHSSLRIALACRLLHGVPLSTLFQRYFDRPISLICNDFFQTCLLYGGICASFPFIHK